MTKETWIQMMGRLLPHRPKSFIRDIDKYAHEMWQQREADYRGWGMNGRGAFKTKERP